MSSRRIRAGLAVLALALAILACNLPGSSNEPTLSAPTPNRTMTALFDIITPQATLPFNILTPTSEASGGVSPSATPLPTTQSVVTATAAPTATSAVAAPTRTATATTRLAGGINVPYLSTAPVLDGVWDEWKTTAYPAKYIVYGQQNIANSSDLEASFRMGWDDTYLYLAVKVIDDKYVQNASGEDIFKGDSIELLLDTDLYGDFNSHQLSGDDYQLVISPGNPDTKGAKEAYLYFPAAIQGSRTQVKISSVGGDGLYRVEAAIPWSVFGVTPAAGYQYGFGVSVSDNDNSSKNVQQSMASNLPDRDLADPTTWAVMTLTR